MKTRILSVTAIVVALVICGANAVKLRRRAIDLQREVQAQTEERLRGDAELLKAKSALKHSERTTQIAIETANRAQRERQGALDEAAIENRHAKELDQEMSHLQRQLADARSALTRLNASTAKQPADVPAMLQETLSKMRQENISLRRTVQRLSEEVGFEPDRWSLPDYFRGKVAAVDPKWGFLVLDAGEDQGALERGELLISRSGKLLAKVRIKETYKDYCIANLMRGWQLAKVMEGDSFTVLSE